MKPHILLGALVAGSAAGLLLRLAGNSEAAAIADSLKPFGQLWIQGLQMTLVPLVFTMVASGIAKAVTTGIGARLIGGAMLLFVLLLLVAVTLGGGATAALVAVWPLPPDALAGLPGLAATAPPSLPGMGEQLLALVPSNPVAAAAAGQMLPLVVFAMLFGVAATRLSWRDGGGIVAFLADIAHMMLTIVGWVLWFAPAGIFLLALGAALHAGFGMASVLGHFLILEILVPVAAIAGCYLLMAVIGRIGVKRFASGLLAPQAMAAGTCSSMATLPAMLETATGPLGIPEPVAGTLLPLAVTSFRFASTASGMVAVMLGAYAAGLHPSVMQCVLAGVVTVMASMGAAGLPAAAVVYALDAPGMQLLGAPLGLIPFYIATIAIPDIFQTTANVTADLTVTTLLADRLTVQQPVGDTVLEPVR